MDLNELERDAASSLPSDSSLERVSSLAVKQEDLEDEIEKIEAALATKKEELRHVAEVLLPQAMQECGISKFTTINGDKVEVKPFYSAKIGEDNQFACFSWLRENGHDDIIKNEIKTTFGRGEDMAAAKVAETLKSLHVSFTQKESVHPQTLTAFVREQVESGANFPLDTFKVFIGQKAKIKRSK